MDTNVAESRIRWVDAFPWIPRALIRRNRSAGINEKVDMPRRWLRAIDDTHPGFDDLCSQLVELAYETMSTWTIAEIFPLISEDEPLSNLGGQDLEDSKTATTRWQSFGDVAEFQLEELFEGGYVSIVRMREILVRFAVFNAALFVENSKKIDELTPLSPDEDWFSEFTPLEDDQPVEQASGPFLEKPEPNENETKTLAAITTILQWLASNNELTKPIFKVLIDGSGAPADVTLAVETLENIRGLNWLEPEEPGEPVFALLEDFLETFDERDNFILWGRLLTVPKMSLEAIGQEFDLTRERIRQLESIISAKVSHWFETNKDVSLHSELIRHHVGKICSLESLLEKFPALDENLYEQDTPSWFAFDQFDDSFESDGTWVTVPSLRDVAAEFDAIFDENATEDGYIETSRLAELVSDWGSADFETILLWAQSRGYSRVGDVLAGTTIRSMQSLAVVALAHFGEPTAEEELHALVAPQNTIRAFSNQLAGDPRLIRAGAGTWALASWGGTEYRGIREEILRRVDLTGSTSLAALLEELPALFNVAPASVRTYATSWPLEAQGDVVRRAIKPVTPNRPIHRGRGVAFIDGGLAYRLVVNADHMRGSGFPIPSPLAGAIGLVQSQTKDFEPTSDEKPVKISWIRAQAQVSSIRPNLMQLGADVGDVIALTFRDGVSNVVSYGQLKTEPGEAIRQLLLLDPLTPMTTASVASALGLPSASTWDEILQLVQIRHETELLVAIQSFMGVEA